MARPVAPSTPDELALLHNPLLRMNGSGVWRIRAKQAYRSWCVFFKDVLAAVRRALIRLGPDAASALPVVIELFDQGDTSLANSSNEMDERRVAMVRMGRPIEDVPFPPRLTVEQIARLRSDLRRSVERAHDHPGWNL
jgi:hypothetical protein